MFQFNLKYLLKILNIGSVEDGTFIIIFFQQLQHRPAIMQETRTPWRQNFCHVWTVNNKHVNYAFVPFKKSFVLAMSNHKPLKTRAGYFVWLVK
jgi:hypothetical protein